VATNRAKLRQAILYFLYHANGQHLGRTKLMKLLYFLDFEHVRAHGRPITGAVYRKLPHGPVAVEALDELMLLAEDGWIDVRPRETARGRQTQYQPHAPLDLSVFGESEKLMLETVADTWRDAMMDDAVLASHTEYPWNSVGDNEVIPFRSAFVTDVTSPPSHELREAMIQSIIRSQGLEGVEISYEQAARSVDRAFELPLADIG
jgi:uncharacterized phage-associated protein